MNELYSRAKCDRNERSKSLFRLQSTKMACVKLNDDFFLLFNLGAKIRAIAPLPIHLPPAETNKSDRVTALVNATVQARDRQARITNYGQPPFWTSFYCHVSLWKMIAQKIKQSHGIKGAF